METSKKILSILLAVLLLAGCMATAFAASGTDGNITWRYDEATKTLTISGTGDMPDYDYIDPAWCRDTGVTEDLIEHLIIENGVTSVGNWAFNDCHSLTSVTIPNSVTRIGDSAFQRCSALTSVSIPDSVTNIDRYAFYNCFALTSVTIPSSVTSIGFFAFRGCGALTAINYTGSKAQWNSIAFGQDALPQGVTVNYNYGQSQSDPGTTPTDLTPENVCPWCGGVHEGLIQGVIGFFHRILAAIFGARY